MAGNLFYKKPIDELIKQTADDGHGLKKVLGALNLTTLGIGAIIGAGIFVLTGQVAAKYAGPAIVISFLFSSSACVFAGLCYAEFASMIPISGSAYTYSYATLGEFFAWIIGWDLILEYLFGATTVSVGWSSYVVSFFTDLGIAIPPFLCNAPLMYDAQTGWHWTGALINLPAVFIVALLSMLLILGIRESARFNNIIVIIKLCVIFLFIGFGASYVVESNWVPFIPPNTGEFGSFGWSGIFRGAAVIFFAYIGFDVVSTAAQEAKNPQRDMPIGILGSLVICTILYVLVALVLTGIVKYDQLNVADPIAVGVNAAGQGLVWLRPFVKIGAIAGLSSVILVLLFGQPRIFYSMAVDGLLPDSFARVHPKFRTPYVTTILTGIVGMVIAGLFPIDVLGEMVSIGTLLAFTMVCIGVFVLRLKRPDIPRAFKAPLWPVVSLAGAVISFWQMASLPLATWMRLVAWMLIGIAIYFCYSRRNAGEKRQMQSPRPS
jgi:APA family basic amino acid/polyamine antiporter